MRQAHFSPVVFVHFCAYYLQISWIALIFLILWSHCACAAGSFLASRLCSLLCAYLQMPRNALSFLFQSKVLLRMRQARFSPVVFVHIFAYLQIVFVQFCLSANARKYLLVSILLRMRQAHLSPVVFVHICVYLQFLCMFHSVVLLRMRQAHFSPVVFVHFLRLSAIPFLCFILWSYCACARVIP
jgi:hypothetical protein